MLRTLLALLICIPAWSMQRVQVPCTIGGVVVVTSGVNSTIQVQASYPKCNIEVFITGSGGSHATIYSDNIGTPLSNPFTASSMGFGYFYATNGRVDVQISGGVPNSIPSPFTFGDIIVFDPVAAGVVSPIYTLSASGTLAIQSDIAPITIAAATVAPTKVQVNLKQAPLGADLIVVVYQGITPWITVTVPSSTISASASSGDLLAAGNIVSGNLWRVDLTQVGTTFPGSDISVTIQ